MKRMLLSISVWIACTTLSFSQEKVKKLSDSLEVHYSLNDRKELEGLYTIKDNTGETLIRGIYKNGSRVGNWFAFNKDKTVFIRYDYDGKQLLQLDTNQIKAAEIKVIAKDSETSDNARIPFPVFPLEVYIDLIKEKAKTEVPAYQRNPQMPILAEITAEIDEKGNAKYHLKYIYDNKTFNTQFKYAEKLVDFGWIPAQYQDQVLASEFKVFARFLFPNAPDHKRVIWN